MKTTLGQRLQAAIDRAGIHAAALASAAGTTEATISNWLRDNVQIEHVKAVQLFRIADAAKTDPRELLLGDSAQLPQWVAEDRSTYSSHPLKQDVLTIAVQLVTEALAEGRATLPPPKQAEAISLAYDLLEEGMPRAKVLRFVLAAVA